MYKNRKLPVLLFRMVSRNYCRVCVVMVVLVVKSHCRWGAFLFVCVLASHRTSPHTDRLCWWHLFATKCKILTKAITSKWKDEKKNGAEKPFFCYLPPPPLLITIISVGGCSWYLWSWLWWWWWLRRWCWSWWHDDDDVLRQWVKPSWIELNSLPMEVRRIDDDPSCLTVP